jgi:hypothetical protein
MEPPTRRDIASACFDEVRKGSNWTATPGRPTANHCELTRAALGVINFEINGIIPEDLKGQR